MTDPRVLEPIAARGWPAAESAKLGGWRLHASAGQSGRINTCWPLGAPDRGVDEAVAAAETWYAVRGLSPRFKIVEGCSHPPDLAERLAARGYAPRTPTLTMVGPLAGELDANAALLAEADATVFEALAEAFGQHYSEDELELLSALLARVPGVRQ